MSQYKPAFLNIFQHSIENGFIYNKKTQIYFDLETKQELSPFVLPRRIQSLKESGSQPIPHPGSYKLPIKLVNPLKPDVIIKSPLALINRLEFLPGLSGFAISPNHTLYNQINGLKVIHPLTTDSPNKYSPPHKSLRLLPIVKLSQDSTDTTPYIRPIFAGNSLEDYNLAMEHGISAVKSVDVSSHANFEEFLDIVTPLRESKSTDGRSKMFFDLEKDGEKKSIVIFPGRKNIPIPHANKAIYNHLKDSLIACDPSEATLQDPNVFPGEVEPIVNGQWYIDTEKVRRSGLEEYFDREKSKDLKSNLATLLSKSSIQQVEDFPITIVAKNGRLSKLFELETEDQRELLLNREYLRSSERLDGYTVLPDWVGRLAFSSLDWYNSEVRKETRNLQGSDAFSDFPIVLQQGDMLLKEMFTLAALASPDTLAKSKEKLLTEYEEKKALNPLRKIKDPSKLFEVLDAVVIGQDIIGPQEYNILKNWNLKHLAGLRAGASVSEVTGNNRLDPLERPEGERYTRKPFDLQRSVLADSFQLSEEAMLINEKEFDDAQGLLSCLFQLTYSRYASPDGLPLLTLPTLDAETYNKFARPFERYTLYRLRDLERDVWNHMEAKRFYEAKQLVDEAILLVSGRYLPSFSCELLDISRISRDRLVFGRSVYEAVVKLVCRLAYPFYPLTAEQTFYMLSYDHAGALAGWKARKLQREYYGFSAVKKILTSEDLKKRKEFDVGAIGMFLNGIELTKGHDYEPGKLMFEVMDALENAILRGPVPRKDIRAYLTIHDSSKKQLQNEFGYDSRADVNEYMTLNIKRVCRIGRMSIPRAQNIFNSGRIESLHIRPGMNLHIFDHAKWTTTEEFEQMKSAEEAEDRYLSQQELLEELRRR